MHDASRLRTILSRKSHMLCCLLTKLRHPRLYPCLLPSLAMYIRSHDVHTLLKCTYTLMMTASGPNKSWQWPYCQNCIPLGALQNCGWLTGSPVISPNHSLTWPLTRAEDAALLPGRQVWALLKAASTNLLLSLAMS